MLINLSNHPMATWSDKQKQEAIQRYGTIKDIAFPLISPSADISRVLDLVSKYENQIVKLEPSAVHVMGELTFVFALTYRLKRRNITCIASTSLRRVEEIKGGKKVFFDFEKFREYKF